MLINPFLFSLFIDTYPKSTFLIAHRPYHNNATQASFEIKFLSGANNQMATKHVNDPIAFCDNIYISLELTSATSVAHFRF